MGGYDDGLIPTLSWAFLASASYYYVLPFTSIFLIVVGGQGHRDALDVHLRAGRPTT